MLRRLAVCGGLLLGLTAWGQEEGPVAAWDFDEAAGPAEDRSGNGITATMRGAARIARGNGFALSFDGQDDYVDCGAPPGSGPARGAQPRSLDLPGDGSRR